MRRVLALALCVIAWPAAAQDVPAPFITIMPSAASVPPIVLGAVQRMPMLKRFFMPPDSLSTRLSRYSDTPNTAGTPPCKSASLFLPVSQYQNLRLSLADSFSISGFSCGTKPIYF